MIDRYFRAHPRSVGETYFQHMHSASSFSYAMITAGIACFLHGIFPNLFVTTGSRTVMRLHDRMIAHRARTPKSVTEAPVSASAVLERA